MRLNIKQQAISNRKYRELDDKIGEIQTTQFKVKGKVYDILPIMVLMQTREEELRQIECVVGEMLYLTQESKERAEELYTTGVVKVKSVSMCERVERYIEEGMLKDIERALYIGREEGVYKGGLGGYAEKQKRFEIPWGVSHNRMDLRKRRLKTRDKEGVLLSGVYSVTMDMYYHQQMNEQYKKASKGFKDLIAIREIVLKWSSYLEAVEGDKLLEAYKYIQSYYLKWHKKEGKEVEQLLTGIEISGDIEKDLEGLGYKYILEYIEKERGEYVKELPEGVGLTKEEKLKIELYNEYNVSELLQWELNVAQMGSCLMYKEKTSIGVKKEKEMQKQLRLEEKRRKSEEKAWLKEKKELEKERDYYKTLNIGVEEREKEKEERIKELEETIRALESKNEYKTLRVRRLEEKIEELESRRVQPPKKEEERRKEVEESEKEKETQVEKEKESQLEKGRRYEEVKYTRFMIVGGTSKWFKRVKEYYPNAVHQSVEDGVVNYKMPMNIEKVLIMTKHVKHAMLGKVKNADIETYYLNSMQLEEILEILEKKR